MSEAGGVSLHPWPTRIRARSYRQFSADYSLDVPAESYGGWHSVDLDFDLDATALVVMHAWDCGGLENYPGWYRAVEYLPRSEQIAHDVFPPLLAGARAAGLTVFHVVGGPTDYYSHLSGYRRARSLIAETPPVERISPSPTLAALRAFRAANVFPGAENREDVERGRPILTFLPTALPVGDEGVAESSDQLFALCRAEGIEHLVYVGFALDGCLLLSPGGMVDLSRRGILCSTIAEGVTSIENAETARTEQAKAVALWRVALLFGFVFGLEEFLDGLNRYSVPAGGRAVAEGTGS